MPKLLGPDCGAGYLKKHYLDTMLGSGKDLGTPSLSDTLDIESRLRLALPFYFPYSCIIKMLVFRIIQEKSKLHEF